jgi:hypothetical protein
LAANSPRRQLSLAAEPLMVSIGSIGLCERVEGADGRKELEKKSPAGLSGEQGSREIDDLDLI